MKKLYRLACLMLSVCLLVVLSACGGGASSSAAPASEAAPASSAAASTGGSETAGGGEGGSIGYVAKAGDAYMHKLEEGVRDFAAENGLEYFSMTTVEETAAEEQIAKVEDLIAMECDMLVIHSNLPDSMVTVLTKAAESGMKIVPIENEVKFEGRVAFVGVSEVETSKEGGLILCEELGEGANVVIITGQAGSSGGEDRAAGYQQACDEAGVNVLETYYSDWSAEDTASAMEDYIVSHGDAINGALFASDSMTIGAIEAIKAAGMTDQIKICSKGGFEIAKTAMENGEMSVDIAHRPYDLAKLAAETAYKAFQGETVEEYVTAPVSIFTTDDIGSDDFENFAWIQ